MEQGGDILLWLVALVLVGAGLAGTVLPALPGPALVLGGLVLAAWIDDFSRVGTFTIVLLVGLALAAHLLDFVAGALGTKRSGASARAALGATLGGVVGVFFGPIGIVVGPFAGAVLGELSARPQLAAAGRAGIGAWVGWLLGTVAKIAVAIAMVGLFALSYFF